MKEGFEASDSCHSRCIGINNIYILKLLLPKRSYYNILEPQLPFSIFMQNDLQLIENGDFTLDLGFLVKAVGLMV